MVSSVSGQDEPNRALWLATRAGKMEPSCPLGTTHCIPRAKFHQKPYNKSFIDQVCSVKMAGSWPRSFFASLWTSTSSRSINTQKKNVANIQPSWPHTWSITHTSYTVLIPIFWLVDLYRVILACDETATLTSLSWCNSGGENSTHHSHYTMASADSKFDDFFAEYSIWLTKILTHSLLVNYRYLPSLET